MPLQGRWLYIAALGASLVVLEFWLLWPFFYGAVSGDACSMLVAVTAIAAALTTAIRIGRRY